MKLLKSFALILLCVTLSDALTFPRIFGRRDKNLTGNELTPRRREEALFLGDPDNLFFNFTLHFFYRMNRSLAISDPSEFFKIKPFYKPQYKNVFVVHGWQNSWPADPWIDQMKEMVFRQHRGKVNFFIVDWAKLAANRYYYTSAKYTKVVGYQLAKFIAFVKEKFSTNMDSVHLIGHSLGAHVCGFAGKRLQKSGITIGKITGLDPAGPAFTVPESEKRLDRDDAKLVEVLHTNMGRSTWQGLGNILKLGDVDIFLNGGARQKGCYSFLKDRNHDDYIGSIDTRRIRPSHEEEHVESFDGDLTPRQWTLSFFCHHARAVDFYLETRKSNSPCQRVAYECDLYKNFLDGKCASCGDRNEKCRLFEYNADSRLNVPLVRNYSYFMDSNPSQPFCANHYQLQIQIDESNFKSASFELVVNGDRDSATFELKGDWNGDYFTTLVTTEKYLGNLKSATGHFKSSWFERHGKQIEFISMTMNYMSNINPRIRQKLSAELVAQPSNDGFYQFDLAYDDFSFEN